MKRNLLLSREETRQIPKADIISGASVTVSPDMYEETKESLIKTLTGLSELQRLKS